MPTSNHRPTIALRKIELAFFITLFIVVLLTYTANAGTDSTYRYKRISNTYYNISTSNGFTHEVVAHGVQIKNKSTVIDVKYTELEEIKTLQAEFESFNGKSKSIKEFTTRSMLTNAFYAGVNSKSFTLEPQPVDYNFSYRYQIHNKELIFLSYLSLWGPYFCDTIDHVIKLPSDLDLLYNVSGDTNLVNYNIKSSPDGKGNTLWEFTSVRRNTDQLGTNKKFRHDPTYPPGVRICILPKRFNKDGYAFMNEWYQHLISPQSTLSETSQRTIRAWGEGKTGQKLIHSIFDSVKSKISYIAFENGIGALQPRNVNEVLEKRQGDCKDMANLLRQSLNLFGFEASIAISSSINYPFDLDFPSISSANHAICYLKSDQQEYFLDPTESCGFYNYPSRHIQGKKILVISEKGYHNITVPEVSNKTNTVNTVVLLNIKDKTTYGTFETTLHGLSQLDILTYKETRSSQEFEDAIKKYLTSLSRNIKFTDIKTTITDTSLNITANIKAENAVLAIDNKYYISQNILIFPHSFPTEIADDRVFIFYEAQHRTHSYQIQIPNATIESKPPAQNYSDDDFQFNYTTNYQNNTLYIDYSFDNKSLLIKDQAITNYNSLNNTINKLLNKKISYALTD